jgi:RNA polymerase sigma-70 factor, ECF subfamily
MPPLPTQYDINFEEMMKKAQAGDQEACGWLLDACRPGLLRCIRQKRAIFSARNWRDSDVSQETLLKAIAEIETFKGCTPEQLDGWIQAIFDRTMIDLWRRSRAKRRDVQRETSTNAPNFEESLRNAAPSAHEIASKHEQGQLLSRIIVQLPTDQAQAVRLRREKASFEEIGRQMGRSTDAARHLYIRALTAVGKEAERLNLNVD